MMDHLAELYNTLPLTQHGSQIRVLDVAIMEGPFNGCSIQGTLRVVDLVDSPKYTALSYVWGKGPSEPECQISCGTYTIPVTRNCFSAIYHLGKRFGAMTIWVDAICINQRDGTEKISQLPLMVSIYPKAEVVYVWLGDGTVESDIAMAYLEEAGYQRYLQTDGEMSYKTPSNRSFSLTVAWLYFTRKIRYLFTYMKSPG
jgi:hypothetical protein